MMPKDFLPFVAKGVLTREAILEQSVLNKNGAPDCDD